MSIMPLSIMTLNIMTLIIMSLNIVVFGVPTVITKTSGRTFFTNVVSVNSARHSKFR